MPFSLLVCFKVSRPQDLLTYINHGRREKNSSLYHECKETREMEFDRKNNLWEARARLKQRRFLNNNGKTKSISLFSNSKKSFIIHDHHSGSWKMNVLIQNYSIHNCCVYVRKKAIFLRSRSTKSERKFLAIAAWIISKDINLVKKKEGKKCEKISLSFLLPSLPE